MCRAAAACLWPSHEFLPSTYARLIRALLLLCVRRVRNLLFSCTRARAREHVQALIPRRRSRSGLKLKRLSLRVHRRHEPGFNCSLLFFFFFGRRCSYCGLSSAPLRIPAVMTPRPSWISRRLTPTPFIDSCRPSFDPVTMKPNRSRRFFSPIRVSRVMMDHKPGKKITPLIHPKTKFYFFYFLLRFYLRKSHTSKKWIVFLEGGWYCYDKYSCHNRWLRQRHYMTSAHWPETRDGK